VLKPGDDNKKFFYRWNTAKSEVADINPSGVNSRSEDGTPAFILKFFVNIKIYLYWVKRSLKTA